MDVQPIAVQLITLQQVMPDVTLRLGQSLLARVAERHGDRGILMIAGQPLVAQLPEHVRAGDVLKLAVRDITAEQVVMQMHEGKEAAETAAQQQRVRCGRGSVSRWRAGSHPGRRPGFAAGMGLGRGTSRRSP